MQSAVFLNLLLSLGALTKSKVSSYNYDESEIHGYHFHTYFFQNNEEIAQEAMDLRDAIQNQIDIGRLRNCRLNRVNLGPRGPHPIGSYETCCNKTSISQALSFFMLNHGNLSVLLHPLTKYEVLDHTDRSMFLGPRMPLDISVLSEDLGDQTDKCLPLRVPTLTKRSETDEDRGINNVQVKGRIGTSKRADFDNYTLNLNV